ncbi:hypothetical protein MTX78_09970 [Hymenobacter tibetensis]|uniref:Glycosyltransferase RgtA/B/C/D-like domain-containing protein n=1 Tax=Hymenobacter tibetensis TaxID=497967 RepID=A0ABY4D3Y1_9BACT|nr:hypothetical protein [Hymenobacter tibetensis]UOG76907.1 hypothetical protein MTX78_09970 [Hymenobacter tibetensis]
MLLAAGWGLGCYFETNDDPAIIMLLRGTTAGAPVTDLHLYFHGVSAVLAALYQLWPALPWFGLLLYGLLYIATVLTFTVLDRLLVGRVPSSHITVLLVLFFLVAWLEHGFWFNYVRVPVLLAGAGVLFAAQRPRSRGAFVVGILAFGLSWLIRPSTALMGLLLAAPGAYWLSGRWAMPILAAALVWAGLGAGVLRVTRSPQAAALAALDVPKANLNDFQLLRPVPRTSSDSLALQDVAHWMMTDSTRINLAMFERATRLEPRWFLREIAPTKLQVMLRLLVRDYFPLLLLQAVLLGWVISRKGLPEQRWFWLTQAGYIGLLVLLGVVLKLPPRVGLPLFDFWVISNLLYVLRPTRHARQLPLDRPVVLVLAALAVMAGPYAYKTWHRRVVLQAERHHNELLRTQFTAALPATALLVTDVLPATYKAASPFENPDAVPAKMLTLAGWTTANPSQAAWRQQLTGTRDFAESMYRLAQQGPKVRWLLTPEGAKLLNQHLKQQQPEKPTKLEFISDNKVFTNVADVYQYYHSQPTQNE